MEEEMRVYEFNTGGGYFWYAAMSPAEALGLMAKQLVDAGHSPEEIGDELVGISEDDKAMRPLSRGRLARLKFMKDDGAKWSMLAEFEQCVGPCLIGTDQQ